MDALAIIATTYIEGRTEPSGHIHARAIVTALHAAGYTIVHRDENHGPTLERAAGIADGAAIEFDLLIEDGKGEHGKPGYVTDAVWHSWYGKLSALNSIAAAIRAMEVKHDG